MQGHKPIYANEDVAEYNVTNLNNGFTVLTESQIFPGSVHMGKSSAKRQALSFFLEFI